MSFMYINYILDIEYATTQESGVSFAEHPGDPEAAGRPGGDPGRRQRRCGALAKLLKRILRTVL